MVNKLQVARGNKPVITPTHPGSIIYRNRANAAGRRNLFFEGKRFFNDRPQPRANLN